ncbi:hypothetical protein GCM10018793_43910 [Streptomyces sulfonofaciens]|uniref:Tyr recombinase domain-containing protein n=1 Tax=Streptomyces sulfonofaciens TaxID=68272 RepID=A0A919GEL8_9ACTN|nr:tyrosine-type recombinase/integrase [Streptomyces sulfonofaciens]GHH82969.1 hypothetical protein GCM10018793_43910 [Streptomyces sulfonofaciens]
MPPIRLHDLRHGAATHALSAGVDVKVVQEMLGHSSSTLTRETYTSVADEVEHHAAGAVARVILAAGLQQNSHRNSLDAPAPPLTSRGPQLVPHPMGAGPPPTPPATRGGVGGEVLLSEDLGR